MGELKSPNDQENAISSQLAAFAMTHRPKPTWYDSIGVPPSVSGADHATVTDVAAADTCVA